MNKKAYKKRGGPAKQKGQMRAPRILAPAKKKSVKKINARRHPGKIGKADLPAPGAIFKGGAFPEGKNAGLEGGTGGGGKQGREVGQGPKPGGPGECLRAIVKGVIWGVPLLKKKKKLKPKILPGRFPKKKNPHRTGIGGL